MRGYFRRTTPKVKKGKVQRQAARGEGYAERYARQYADVIWHRYVENFEMYGVCFRV